MKELRILSTVNEGATVDLSGSAVVVIDVLRATTSITYMFESGAKAVFPVGEVGAARTQKEKMPHAVLCGERNGVAPDGFDMGNSPSAFKNTDLSGKEIILTTTNGTQAVSCALNSRVLVAAGCGNAAAVARYICTNTEQAPVYLLCAGTKGAFSIEDFYCAGLIASRIHDECDTSLNDFAWAAVKLAELPVKTVVNAETCKHLDFLSRSGFEEDVSLSLSWAAGGTIRIVPVYDRNNGCFLPEVI